MSGRTFAADGTLTQGRLPALKRPTFTEENVAEPALLADVLTQVAQAVERLNRNTPKDYIDFEDVAVTTVAVRLEHRLNSRVRWWVVDWVPTSTGTRPLFEKTTATSADVLVLLSGAAGTATIRVEPA